MNDTPSPLLQVRDLKKYFPVRQGFLQSGAQSVCAVDGVDLDIAANQTLGLVGESGCGKSTVARLILRLLYPDDGRIRFEGQEITHLNERRFKPLRKKIQIIFQDPYSSLNPRMTVAQTIGEGVRMAGIGVKADQRRRIEQLLDMVGMPAASAERYPHEFSGGQRQRVGIARALSVAPQLIVCDEPISALDVSIQAQIINLLKDLQKELGLSYLFISHDLNVVSYICDHVCVMYRGQIMESAPVAELFDNPLHPYTLKLLSSAPRTADAAAFAEVKAPAQGQTAEALCSFASQSSDSSKERTTQSSALREMAPSHFVRCP